jgi:ferritin
MIHDELVAPLNDQITSEAYASQVYLQMSMWSEDRGLPGASAFFRSHVGEELEHRNRLVDHLVEAGASVRLQPIPAPPTEYESLVGVVSAAYAHEKKVTEQIDALAGLALDRKDFNTFNMLQWFIAEQREELVLFRGIVDYMKLAAFTGGPGDALVNLDRFLLEQAHKHQ